MTVTKDEKILPPGWSPQPKAPFEVDEWVDFAEFDENAPVGFQFAHAVARIDRVAELVVYATIKGYAEKMIFAPRFSDGTYVRITHPSELISIPDFVPNDDEHPTKIYRGRYTEHLSELKAQKEAEAKAAAERQAKKSKIRRVVESAWAIIWAP